MSQAIFKIEGADDGSIKEVMLWRSTITDQINITVVQDDMIHLGDSLCWHSS